MEKHELYKRVLKHLAMFLIIFVSCLSISHGKLCSSDILMLSMLATTGVGILDLYYPSVCVNNI